MRRALAGLAIGLVIGVLASTLIIQFAEFAARCDAQIGICKD